EKPKSVSELVVSNPKINRDSVIIEDWKSDDEDDEYEVQTVRPESNRVLTRTGLHRPSVSTARPSVSTARPICTARQSISTARPVYATRPTYPRMDNVRSRGSCSSIKRSYYTKLAFRPKDLKQDVKTFRVQNMTTARIRAVVNTGKGKLDTDLKKSRWVWRPKGNYLDHVSKDSRLFMLKKGNPEILLQDHAVGVDLWMQKESVSKQGRKSAKSTPTAHTDQVFDDVDVNDAMDYMETDAYMQKGMKEVEVSTDKLDEGTVKLKDGTSDESTALTTVFRDDETKQKGVEIKDAEDLDRPRATSTRSVLTLKPLPKIDPKDKGKKVLEEEAESDAESEGVDEAKRKFDQLAKDEEIAKKVQVDWEAKEEMKKLAEEEATKATLIQDFDDIHARIKADRLLAARL
ncbi:hypothetical protein Tco_1459728, partial [Tanacetum coccineum]